MTPVPSSPQRGGTSPHAAAPLTSVLGGEAVVGVLHEDHVVRLKHGLRGGVEVAVEPHVGVGAAVIADLDDTRGVTQALQGLGTAAPWLPCKGEQAASQESPQPGASAQNSKGQLRKRRRRRNHKIAEIAPNERLVLERQSLLGRVGGSWEGRERKRKEERERKNEAICVGLQPAARSRTDTQQDGHTAAPSGGRSPRLWRLQRDVQDTGRCPWLGTLFTPKLRDVPAT